MLTMQMTGEGKRVDTKNTKEEVVLLAVIEYTEWLTVLDQKCHLHLPVQPVPSCVCHVFPVSASAIFVQLLTCWWHLDGDLRVSIEG